MLAAAAVLHGLSVLSAGLFIGAAAFLLSVAGAVVALYGFGVPRAVALLQLLAARIAEAPLLALHQHALRQGNILTLNGRGGEVSKACSGLRYLLGLGFTAVLCGYLAGARPWVIGVCCWRSSRSRRPPWCMSWPASNACPPRPISLAFPPGLASGPA